MKKHRGLKLIASCLVVGLAGGWWLLRDRHGSDEESRKEQPAYADTLAGYDSRYEVPGEIAVDFVDDVDTGYVEALGRRLGLVFVAAPYADHDRIYVAEIDRGVEAEDLAALRRDPKVEAAEEELVFSLPENDLDAADEAIRDTTPQRDVKFPNDPRYGEQWHMHQIHMDETFSAAQGQGVIVAVIDTGVSRTQDLQQTEFVAGRNFVDNSDDASDDHGHGTHVAGTIAQSTHNGIGVAGVAHRAKIMPIKVLSAQGSGSVVGIAEGIRWASDHGAKVINMSLGGAMSSQILGKAVKYAHDHGTTVVCAAGNDGKGKVSYPAAYPGAIAVASTQKDERTAFYSNWGKQIDIAAPGGNTRGDPTGGVLQNTIYQGKDDYYFFMGTSMASPHIAGVAALIVSQGVTEPDAVEKVLKATARKPQGQTGTDSEFALHYGAGIVDAQAAVRKAQLGDGAIELGVGGALALLALGALRRRGKLASFGLGGLAALVMGSSGLFFLPSLGLGGMPGVSMLAHGVPGWDEALFGAAGHGNLLFYSALLPVGLAVLFYGWKRGRGLLAGFALGVAGHLIAQAWLGHVGIHWMTFDALWLVANGVVCTAVAYAVARK